MVVEASTGSLWELLLQASVSFVFVNLDEFVVLILFFTQANTKDFTSWHVFLGQLLGFSIVLLISLLGALCGASVLTYDYLALLGLLPLCLGIYDLYRVVMFWRKRFLKKSKANEPKQDSANSGGGYYQMAPLSDPEEGKNTSAGKDDSSSDDSGSDGEEDGVLMTTYKGLCGSLCNVNVVVVSAVIVADGSEEIAVFLPLLAAANNQHASDAHTSLSFAAIAIIVLFYTLILLQCFLAFALVNFSRSCLDNGSVNFASRYSKNILPFILIGLGLYVLQDSVLFQ